MISLGLKFSSQQLRYALVSHSKKKWHCVESGILNPSPLTLKQLSRKANRVVLGLSASHILTKKISTPLSLSYMEVASTIQTQLASWFGQGADLLQFDFFPLSSTATHQHWQVIATRRSLLKQQTQSLFNMKLTAIDVDIFALLRLSKDIITPGTNDFIWVFNEKSQAVVFSVKKREIQRFVVLKKQHSDSLISHLLIQHIRQLQEKNEPIFLSGVIEPNHQIPAKIIQINTPKTAMFAKNKDIQSAYNSSEYLDCIGLALWNAS